MDTKQGKRKGMATYQTGRFAAGKGGDEPTVRMTRPRGVQDYMTVGGGERGCQGRTARTMPRASGKEFGDGSTTVWRG